MAKMAIVVFRLIRRADKNTKHTVIVYVMTTGMLSGKRER